METTEILKQTSTMEEKTEEMKQTVVKKSFAQLVSQIRERLKKNGGTTVTGRSAYEFHLSDQDGVFYVEIRDGQIEVQPYDYHDNDGVFTASTATYEALCDGSLTPITAYAAGRLKISGDIGQVKTLMKIFA